MLYGLPAKHLAHYWIRYSASTPWDKQRGKWNSEESQDTINFHAKPGQPLATGIHKSCIIIWCHKRLHAIASGGFFKHTGVCHSFVLKPPLQQCTQWESRPMEPLVVDMSTLLTVKHEAERTVLCWWEGGWRINSLLQHFFTHFYTEDSSPGVGPHPPGSYAWSDTHLLFTAGAVGGKWAMGWPTSAWPALKPINLTCAV